MTLLDNLGPRFVGPMTEDDIARIKAQARREAFEEAARVADERVNKLHGFSTEAYQRGQMQTYDVFQGSYWEMRRFAAHLRALANKEPSDG